MDGSRAPARVLTVHQAAGVGSFPLLVPDLLENTSYFFLVRYRSLDERWTPLKPLATCRTSAPTVDQISGVRRVNGLERDAIHLCWTPSVRDAHEPLGVEATLRQLSASPARPPSTLAPATYQLAPNVNCHRFESLPAPAEFEFQLRTLWRAPEGELSRGPWSDPVSYSTAQAGTTVDKVFRGVELCPRGGCDGPDYLSNHDAADATADAVFLTIAGGTPFLPSSFNETLVVEYCVERRDEPLGGYLACNGPTTDAYRCTCDLLIDRWLAREDTTGCSADPRNLSCPCALEERTRGVGAMDLYLPLPRMDHHRKIHVTPRNESVRVGRWFSYPRDVECAAHERPGESCAWRRLHSAVVITGEELLRAGWVQAATSPHHCMYGDEPCNVNVDTVRANANLLRKMAADRRGRCCGC